MKLIFCIVISCVLAITTTVSQVRVYYFVSPTCPICKFYTVEMREIAKDYSGHGVDFKAFAVGPLLTDSAVAAFRANYQLPFDVIRDDTMHRSLNATVTPEVFVMDSDAVVYHGRIDDSFVRVGKRRAHVKNRELRNALNSLLNSSGRLATPYVPPIGCIIEK